MIIQGKTWLHRCDAALPDITNRNVMGLYKYMMTLTSYDDKDSFAILNYLLLRNRDWWDSILSWSCYNAHNALKYSEDKSA
jgi:hypothetical protein